MLNAQAAQARATWGMSLQSREDNTEHLKTFPELSDRLKSFPSLIINFYIIFLCVLPEY
jgi:hypothetical protein